MRVENIQFNQFPGQRGSLQLVVIFNKKKFQTKPEERQSEVLALAKQLFKLMGYQTDTMTINWNKIVDASDPGDNDDTLIYNGLIENLL